MIIYIIIGIVLYCILGIISSIIVNVNKYVFGF